MNLEDPTEAERWRARLGELFRDRPVISGIMPLAGFTEQVAVLRAAGARRPLLLASCRGAGAVVGADEAEVVEVAVPPSASMTEDLACRDAQLRTLPPEAMARVEAYDPDRAGLWLLDPFVRDEPIAGRPVVGGRPGSWAALEDKLVAEQVWTDAGIPAAPHRVAPCDLDALLAASRALDRGAGTVWAPDGFHGGAERVRRVRDAAEAGAVHRELDGRAARVRVMPFLEGVPCSIHGCVLPTGTAVFRPLELSMLRTADGRFVYGGQGTAWDPPAADRAAMRALARRVGEHLRDRVGYRGFFGVDGVLTADGFRPTELNPRLSGGAVSLGRAVDPGLFRLLQLNLSVGRDPGVDADDLERWAVPRMDAGTFCKALAMSPARVVDGSLELPVAWCDGTLVRRTAAQDDGWRVELGDNPAGTYARLVAPGTPKPGQRAAELNVALLRFLDAELGTGFGEVSAAPDVRARD